MSNVPPPPSEYPQGSGQPDYSQGAQQPYGTQPGQVPQAGSVPPASPYAGTGVPGQPRKQTLSLVSFIAGLASIVIFTWIFGIGLLTGVAAIIIGVLARKREPLAPKWMWIVGIIAGAVAALISIFIIIGTIALFAAAANYNTSY